MDHRLEDRLPLLSESERAATVRLGGGCGLFGAIAGLWRSGACVEFRDEMRLPIGRWVVLVAGGPLQNGYDARVARVDGRRVFLAFDPMLVELDIFKSAPSEQTSRPIVDPQ